MKLIVSKVSFNIIKHLKNLSKLHSSVKLRDFFLFLNL
nr:MAG TPA: hypothetical protein [Caudoviricetes sp.]